MRTNSVNISALKGNRRVTFSSVDIDLVDALEREEKERA